MFSSSVFFWLKRCVSQGHPQPSSFPGWGVHGERMMSTQQLECQQGPQLRGRGKCFKRDLSSKELLLSGPEEVSRSDTAHAVLSGRCYTEILQTGVLRTLLRCIHKAQTRSCSRKPGSIIPALRRWRWKDCQELEASLS